MFWDEMIELELFDKPKSIGKKKKEESIMGMDLKTGKSSYGVVTSMEPVDAGKYHDDPAVTESRVFGSYSSKNPMKDAYSGSIDTSNGYQQIKMSPKGRRGKSITRGRW